MNGAPPEVAVVLPVYNGAATVGATIASVLAQTHRDLELIVVDDGSTDATPAIAAAVADPRVRLHSFPNRGLAASRNRGIRLARSPFVAFIDADDLWTPGKLAAQLAALRARPDAALAYSWTDCIDEHDRRLGPGSHVTAEGRVYERLLAWNFLDNGSSALVRAEALARAGPFDETLPAAEDWDLWLRLAWAYPFACVPEAQVLYRVHGSAMSSAIERQEAACTRVFTAALERLPPSPAREALRREGTANLARYLTGRVLASATGPAGAALAARYWWRFVTHTPAPLATAGWSARQLLRILAAALLPRPVARALARALQPLLGRRAGD